MCRTSEKRIACMHMKQNHWQLLNKRMRAEYLSIRLFICSLHVSIELYFSVLLNKTTLGQVWHMFVQSQTYQGCVCSKRGFRDKKKNCSGFF